MVRLSFMSWNLLHKTWCEDEQEHPWAARVAGARALVEREQPAILAAQEAYPAQMNDLLEGLPDHWWLGLDRQGGTDGEGCPIAYDITRVKPTEHGQFWLGAYTDKPGSLTWVNDVPRIVTWARFRAHEDGARFFVANTHLDHLVPLARRKEIELLQDRLPLGTLDEPVILMGDFNSPAWAKPHRMLMRGEHRFHDTFWIAMEGEPKLSGTYHHFKGTGFVRVDWILVRPLLHVPRFRILRDAPAGEYPSDHFPVVADIDLPPPRARVGAEARSTAARA